MSVIMSAGMKKFTNLVSTFTLLLAGTTLVSAQQPPVAPVSTPPAPADPAAVIAAVTAIGPKIAFETPLYDFGKVKSGEMIKHTFVFTNTGDEVLILTNVQPSCGCTTAGEWSRQVEPGKTGTIPVQFNSANYNGQVLKTITVTSNDKGQPTFGLQLKGTVWKPIEVNPQFAAMNVPAESQEPARAEVRIVNNTDEHFDVFPPEVNNKSFTATLKTNTASKEYVVAIATVPPLEAGNVQATVTLK